MGIEREKAVIRVGESGAGGRWRRRARRSGGEDCALDRGPGTIVEIMKPRRDFSLFSRARGETISRMTDCAIPLAAGPHVVHRREVTLLRETREEREETLDETSA